MALQKDETTKVITPKILKDQNTFLCVSYKIFVYIYVCEQLKINWDILQIVRIIYLSKIDSNWAALSLAGSKELQDLNKMINIYRHKEAEQGHLTRQKLGLLRRIIFLSGTAGVY